MSLSLEDVHRIARLARIEIDDGEAHEMQAKLAGIFALIEQMQQVDTRGVEPMAHAEDVALPLREDLVSEGDQHQRFQENAPEVAHGLYLVPRVID
jgi:aspartyl-tRNA(Asn)/glutamyl-tRNA(Gln) amidotransferase subunit C